MKQHTTTYWWYQQKLVRCTAVMQILIFVFLALFITAANPTTQCDLANGWSQFNSNCYKLEPDLWKSWAAARYDCVTEGGDLVSITSPEEEQYVTGRLDSSHFDLWIGLSTLVRQPVHPYMSHDGHEYETDD